ncbi:MAG: hypothetical protein IJ637_01135, partial [Prevotella sp.]|nr:hypothetical protein [Prevotella sp.]
MGGVTTAQADEVTLAQWYPTASVLYTAGTGDQSNYYTASEATYETIQKNFSDGQPYFYPTTCNVGTATDYTLSFYSSGSGKQWAIRNYNNSAFAFYTEPVQITDYLDGSQHDNYMEVKFPATGYKNLKLSFQISGNNGRTVPLIVVVSTDGGTTWQYGGDSYTSGSSWNNFKKNDISLAVSNCSNVKVRILQGYNADANSDWYQKEISITGEALGGESVYALTTVKPSNGMIQISPVGGSFAESEATGITATAIPNSGYALTEWSDGTETNPYVFSLTANKSLSATFAPATYYTLTTGTNLPWAGTVTRSPLADSYVEGTVVTLTATANEGFTFTGWSTGETTASINVTLDNNKTVTANYDKALPAVGTENATLVSWIFDGQYDAVAGDGNQHIYTPTGGSYSTISNNYSAQTPIIRPDYFYYGSISDYAITGQCDTKWMLGQFYTGSDHYCFYLGSSKSMADVTDYTDPSGYQNYYEASFPTGFANCYYDNLKVTFTPSANNENPGMEYGIVYSIDNGTTWTQITTVNAASHWNGFDKKEFNLPADAVNKSKVLVRIIRKEKGTANSEDNKIDYFTVTGDIKALPVELNEANDYTVAAVENVSVNLTRSITANKWSTIVLPFAIANVESVFGTGTKVAQLTSVNSNTLNFTSVTSMNANEPYMIQVASNFTSAVINDVNIVSGTPAKTVYGVTFQGVYEAGTIPANAFFVSGNQLYKATD